MQLLSLQVSRYLSTNVRQYIQVIITTKVVFIFHSCLLINILLNILDLLTLSVALLIEGSLQVSCCFVPSKLVIFTLLLVNLKLILNLMSYRILKLEAKGFYLINIRLVLSFEKSLVIGQINL